MKFSNALEELMRNLTDLIFRIHATLERTISFITMLRDLLARSKKAAGSKHSYSSDPPVD